jgi:hypothetical protein
MLLNFDQKMNGSESNWHSRPINSALSQDFPIFDLASEADDYVKDVFVLAPQFSSQEEHEKFSEKWKAVSWSTSGKTKFILKRE